jgi:hypothetical protein
VATSFEFINLYFFLNIRIAAFLVRVRFHVRVERTRRLLAYLILYVLIFGVWGSVVVKALRCCASRRVSGSIPSGVTGFFSVASYGTMCPGVDSAFKNEYQDIAGGKDGRCVRATT